MLHRPFPVFVWANVEYLERIERKPLLTTELEAVVANMKTHFMVVGLSIEFSHDSADSIKAIFFQVPLNIRCQA